MAAPYVLAGETPCAVLADHVKSIGWRNRGARRKGLVPPEKLAAVPAKTQVLIG